MKDKIKAGVTKLKNHYEEKKSAYVWGAIAMTAIAIQQRNIRQFYEFLGERDIDPMEFYSPEQWEELNN
jgi:hypothetical protein